MMTLLAFIVTIGILVTIHEFGHYQVAKWCGVRVLRFSVGFGKPLWRKQFVPNGTEFVLASIPLGGYVKMLDERELKQAQEAGEQPEHYSESELSNAFNRKSVYQRVAIVLAGPLANLLLAILLYWLLFVTGVTGLKPLIGEIKADSNASKVSLRSGDLIVRIDNEPIKTWQEARWALLEKSLAQPSVQIEVTDQAQETHIQTLSFAGISNDAEVDILEKLGLAVYQPKIPAVVGEVMVGSAAEKSGLLAGDHILTIDRIRIKDWEQVVSYVKANPNRPLEFTLQRHQQTITLQATPEPVREGAATIGRLGASVQVDKSEMANLLIELHYSPFQALHKACLKTWETSLFSLKMLANMVTGKVSWAGISGPVSIANFAGESAGMGLKVFLGFLALVSISIGVLNLLPIPMLDGGHLMYYIAEIIKGTPVSEKTMIIGQKIGLSILGLLMMVALFNDLNRYMIG
jgi:regulator of sigma E protease